MSGCGGSGSGGGDAPPSELFAASVCLVLNGSSGTASMISLTFKKKETLYCFLIVS